MPTAQQIVRCLKRDLDGDLAAGADYAAQIAANAEYNPFGDPSDSAHYAEAASLLRAEHAVTTAPKPI